VAAAIKAAGEVAWVGSGAPPWAAGGPGSAFILTPFTRMLESAVGRSAAPGPRSGEARTDGKPVHPAGERIRIDPALYESILTIEATAGASYEGAGANARAFLEAVESILLMPVEAEPIDAAHLRDQAEALTALVAAKEGDAAPEPEPARPMTTSMKP
jgi:hypothetical protein